MTGQESVELSLLGRYQRVLLFGGGVALSIVIVFATALALYGTVRDYIELRRSVFMTHKSLVQLEIDSKEAEVRRGVINAELLWSSPRAPSASLLAEFETSNGQVVIQANRNLSPILAIGRISTQQPASQFAEYLGLVEQQAYRASAIYQVGKRSVSGYVYTPDRRFLAFMPAPKGGFGALLESTGTHDVGSLIDHLSFDVGNLSEIQSGSPRHVFWQAPLVDPLTGEKAFQIAEVGFDDGKPFLILVDDFPVSILEARFDQAPGDATIMLVSRSGRVLLARDRTRARIDGDALMRESLASNSWRRGFTQLDDSYHDGVFTVSDRVSDTDWVLVYSYSWRTIAIALQAELLRYLGATLLMLGTLWTLLLLFNLKVFKPIYDRSRRVFESENLNRAIITTSPFGVSLTSVASGTVLFQNEVAERFAASASKATPPLHRQILDLYRQHALETTILKDCEVECEREDDGYCDLLVNATVAKYRGVEALLCCFLDITARKDIERKREEAKIAADQANRAKSAFLAVMSHEIRTPLNAILGNLELLANSPLNTAQKDRLTTIRASSDGLLATISDVLDFSKIEAGEMSLERIEFDLIDVAEHALMIFAPVARKKGVELFGVIDASSEQKMHGDPVRLGQIVHNLLSNAIKFTLVGKVTFRLSIEAIAHDDAVLVLTVEDTGIGMSPEQQSTIFQAFSQADTSINRRFGGSGLGLALSHTLVEAMGGQIAVASELQVGTRFTVQLPLGTERFAVLDRTVFADESVIFLSSADEWSQFAVPHLEAWGLDVQVCDHPAMITEANLSVARALIIFGNHNSWHPSEENRLVENVACVVDCHAEGPPRPVRTGRIVSVSCYSLKGLEAALRQALGGELPAMGKLPQFVAPMTAADSAPSGMGRRLRVLVAEDNAVNQQLFKEQLTMLGCDSRVAGGGKDALDALAEGGGWDVLLTDLNMPGMNGYELAGAVRARWPSLPIMAVTAHATTEELARCEAAGMRRVLTKPLSLEELHDVLAVMANAVDASVTEPQGNRLSVLGEKPIPTHLQDIFTESFTASLAVLQVARVNCDTGGVLAELHSMSGALGGFGQKSLAQQCRALELLVKIDGLDGLDESFVRFELAMRTLIEIY